MLKSPHNKITDRKGQFIVIIADKKLLELYPKACKIAKEMNFNTRDFKLSQSLFRDLVHKTHFGESKKVAKERAIGEHRAFCNRHGQAFRLTDVRLEGIYSTNTFKNYMRVGGRFLEYLDREGLKARTIEQAVKRYGTQYLRDMEDRGLSPYSVLQAKSFMGKVLGREVDYTIAKEKDPTKGRSESVRGRTFSEDLNRGLVALARGTGARRGDLESLKVEDFVKRGDVCIGVDFKGSKGGRDRYTPILPEYQKEISRLVAERELLGKEKVLDNVNSHANIHAYRREYCKALYLKCSKDKDYRDSIAREYKARGKDLSITKEEYKTRDGRTFDRESLSIASQALGHNRLDIIPKNYFQ